MKKLEHIGIAVKNLKESNAVFQKILGKEHYKIEEVESEGVRTSFFSVGEIKIELLEANNTDSPISKFIEKRGEGLHHIAFYVDDLEKEMKRLKDNGLELTQEHYSKGADNKIICFIHPRSTNGVLIELCQEQP